MSRKKAKVIGRFLMAIGWLPYRIRGEHLAVSTDGLRWRWSWWWDSRAMDWGRFWNHYLAPDEERVR